MKELLKEGKDYHTKIFHGAVNDYEMICHKVKIVIPQSLNKKLWNGIILPCYILEETGHTKP